jgi:hypothetical protein
VPPASFVGSSIGTCSNVALQAQFTLPPATKEGDTILLIIGAPTPNAGPNLAALDPAWELAATFASGAGKVWIVRRAAQADELGNLALPFPDGFPAAGLGLCAVWRNLDTGHAIVASASAAIAASTNFACPTVNLAFYSDLFVGVAFVLTAAVNVTPPAGATERAEVQASAMTLEVFDRLREATGATGAQTATTAANQSGIAGSIALAANPLVGFGKSFTLDPPGGIGLPVEGV